MNNNNKPMQIEIYGNIDINLLSATEKRIWLKPLIKTISDFFKDPKNREEFELWKNKKTATNNEERLAVSNK